MCFDHGLGSGCDGVHREEDAPERAVCLHCYSELDEAAAIEAIGEVFCSTLCALAVAAFNHEERCTRGECSDAAECWTLPLMLCCYCDAPTGGVSYHESCRQHVRNALAYQASAGAPRGNA
jgi:hypothetical protein